MALQKFEDIVRNAPEATPLRLSVGNKTRDPVSKLDELLGNIDRVRYHCRRVRSEDTSKSDIGIFASIDSMNPGLIVSSSFKSNDGHVIFQTPGMKEVMLEKANALQTDTIMGFVKDERMPSLNVTCTSTFSEYLECYVPVLVGVLFGMTATHYQQYFNSLIDCHKFVDFEDFKAYWPGNICDFSDSERVGFGNSVRDYFRVEDKDDLELSLLFGACEVHFECSRARVARNHSVVPAQRKAEFDEMVRSLLDPAINKKTFRIRAESIYHRENFPKANKWLQWYLHSDRGPMIFPALGKVWFMEKNNTNGQESMGMLIQQSCQTKNPTLGDCYKHLVEFCNWRVDWKLTKEKTGLRTMYNGTHKRKQVNDGRAPDRTSQLIGKRRGPGRMKYCRNLAPSKNSIQDLSFGIPWSYTHGAVYVTNTCAMDSSLMSLYFLRKYEIISMQSFEDLDYSLNSVLNLILDKKYNEARHRWISSNDRVHTVGDEKGEDVIVTRNKTVSRNDKYWDCWTAVDDVIDIIGLFRMSCREEFGDCNNNDCSATTTGSFCVMKDPVAPKPYLIGEGTSLKIFSVIMRSPVLSRVGDGLGFSYYTFIDRRAGVRCDNIGLSHQECKGKRQNRKVVSAIPMILQVKLNFEDSKARLDEIQPKITVMEKTYLLAVMILSNGSHFQSVILIGGKFLHYNGMKRPPLKWLDHRTKISETGYKVTNLWYAKENLNDVESSPENEIKHESNKQHEHIDDSDTE